MRIAITGSSGYIGQRLVEQLRDRREVETILGLDIRTPARPPEPPFEFQYCDVRRPFADIFTHRGITAAVHLAYTFAPIHDRALATAVNVDGTRHFLDACLAARVDRALVLGSTTAYGAQPDNPVPLTESDPLRAQPAFQYAYEKRRCDELCADFRRRNPAIALVHGRAPIVLGPHVDNYVSRVLFKPKVVGFRDADPPMQFLHEDDIAAAVLAAVDARIEGPYNIAPPGTIRYLELVHDFKRKPLLLPATILGAVAAITYHARLRWINEMPPGALNYIRYPWLADGERFCRDAGFRFTHTTRDAVNAWRDSVRHRLPRLAKAADPPGT